MKLWCWKCGRRTEHTVWRKTRMRPHDNVTPLRLRAKCECGRGGTFIGNAASMSVVGVLAEMHRSA